MLAVFAAVLALAGAPAGTPIICSPTMLVPVGATQPVYGFWGVVAFTDTGVPYAIALYQHVACDAAAYAAATPKRRAKMRADLEASGLTRNWPAFVGAGLLVVLHEAEHVALRSLDECLVEKTALAKLPALLQRYVPTFKRQAWAAALAADASLGTQYHGC